MSALTASGHSATRLSERLLAALNDPARCERNVGLALLVYSVLWAIYGAIAKGSQDIHADMSEQFGLAQELALGYPKHPPLTMLIVRLWFSVFPASDWAYYLLAMANAGLALWIAWRLYARFLTGEKRVLALVLLTFVPFFNFHALKFNSNTILMPLWAGTTLFFLRSFETRRSLEAALAGLCAAAAMYGKYWSAVLLLALAFSALTDPRRAAYFSSAAPWITVLVGGAAMAPHLYWLIANDFAPFSYAVFVHGDASSASSFASVLGYLLGSVAYVSAPLLIVFFLARPTTEMTADMAWPASAERRLAAAVFWATLLLPALIAPLAGVRLTSLWSMSAWTLLPVLLLSSPLIYISHRDIAVLLAVAVAFPLIMIVLAPAIGFAVHRAGSAAEAHSSLLAPPIERLWRETSHQPLKVFASTDVLSFGVPFYLHDHPRSVHVLDRPATPEEEALIQKDGAVLLCPIDAASCLAGAMARAEMSPPGKRSEIKVSRRYFGREGRSARYVAITIPPARPDGR